MMLIVRTKNNNYLVRDRNEYISVGSFIMCSILPSFYWRLVVTVRWNDADSFKNIFTSLAI